jgi:hypothetical protein
MVSVITYLDLLVVGSFMTMTSAITNLDLLVVGSFMTMTSAISPNLEKYSLSPSGVVCQDRPPINIFLQTKNRNKRMHAEKAFLLEKKSSNRTVNKNHFPTAKGYLIPLMIKKNIF